jgi:DNA sulfur modification protein DndD
MILQYMELENFRQFYDKQRIDFAQGTSSKNVTLLHGFNGAGKTTILNAFVWCMYGDTTPDFEASDRLESERAILTSVPDVEVAVSVALRFRWQDKDLYAIRRRTTSRTSANEIRRGPTELALYEFVGGSMQKADGGADLWQNRLNQVLPKGLYPFFFFNGERDIERLARAESSRVIEDGAKLLLDVLIFDRTVKDLKRWVVKKLNDELGRLGGVEQRAALAEKASIEQKQESAQAQLGEHHQNIQALRDTIERIERRQSEIQSIAELSGRRDELRRTCLNLHNEIGESENELARILSESGYLSFGNGVFSKAAKLVAAARERGELPAKIKPQFVDDLLEKALCICGRGLAPGADDAEIARLSVWRSSVGLAALEEAISHVSAAIPVLKQRQSEFVASADRLVARRDRLQSEHSIAMDSLAVIEERIGDKELGDEAVSLKREHESTTRDLVSAMANAQFSEKKLAELALALKDVQDRIKKLATQGQQEALVKRRLESVEKIASVLEEVYAIQRQDVRDDLSQGIAEIWQDAAIRDYRASLRDDFSLSLTKTIGGRTEPVYGASTGEKQVLATAFVGSLVRKARENHEHAKTKPGQLAMPLGGEYPLVMDSPFGALEDEYRQKVAHWLPRLAQQVVLLVSNTQWRDEVEGEIRARVGREYVLELHTAKKGSSKTIRIAGADFNYVVESLDADYTQIREVL